MSNKRKTLAQELAELYNPAPTAEHDPDGLELGDGAKLRSDDDYDDAQRVPSRRAPEKAMLLRGDITLEDAAYRGRKTSRAAVFGDGGSDDDDDEDGLDLGDGEDDGESGDEDGFGGSDEDAGEIPEGEDEGDSEDEELAGAGRRASGGRAGTSGKAAAAATKGRGAPQGGDEDQVQDEDEGEDAELDELNRDSDDDLGDLGDLGDLPTGTQSGSDLEEEEEEDQERERQSNGAAAKARRHAGVGAGAGAAGGDNALDELEAELEALEAEDERQLAELKRKGERDQVKGVAVRNQQVLYERALEQRILLQKCLQASNGLPRPSTYALLVGTQPAVREGFSELAQAARSTLDHLLELQRTLMARVPSITPPQPGTNTTTSHEAAAPSGRGAKRGRGEATDDDDTEDTGGAAAGASGSGSEDGDVDSGLEALWRRIGSHAAALAPYRDASLDSWQRRTVLSAGSGALRNSGLRALNQSISSQVQALMRDPAKFIKRTRLTVAACPRVLCEPPRAGTGAAAAVAAGLGGGQHDEDLMANGTASARNEPAGGATSSVAADVAEEERDAETYDDSEFYQQLLKEFLDKGLAHGAAAGAPKAAKKRKLVDRRASKGRKLRYHVQEKLVAFMAPVDFEPPSFAANLFSNLFGHAGK